MLIARYAKIVLSLALASFCLVVTFDNLTDYGTNYLFLQHVMSMDTTFPGNALMYRSITNPALWQLGYALIIAAEGLAGLLFLAGGNCQRCGQPQQRRLRYGPGRRRLFRLHAVNACDDLAGGDAFHRRPLLHL